MKISAFTLATTLALSALTAGVAAANPNERKTQAHTNSLKEIYLGTSVILAAKSQTPGPRTGHIMISCKPGKILEIGLSFYQNALSGDSVKLNYWLGNEPMKTATFWTKSGERKHAVFQNKSTPAMEITLGLSSAKQLLIQGMNGEKAATHALEFQSPTYRQSLAEILEHCPVKINDQR